MKKILLVLLLLPILNNATAQTDVQAIQNVLTQQAKAWNNGDLDNYMKGYWNNDSLLFIGRGGPGYGYQNTLERYKKGYPDKATMGQLTFSNLSFNQLSDEYYHVIGKYELKRTVGDASGYFTLIFRKMGGKWLIVADHSS